MGRSSAAGTQMSNVPGDGTSPRASVEAGAAAAQANPVQVICLDDYFDGLVDRSVGLIKCDAEGHEADRVQG